jgi:thiol-disulfide isomerase/thioredoxin
MDEGMVLREVHELVDSVNSTLDFCKITGTNLPPNINLFGASSDSPDDPALTQFEDSYAWDVTQSDPDPGQSVSLRKYLPVDYLQLPKKATTRAEALTAIRMCERLSMLTLNQSHCIKNDAFLIVSVIEHVFTQVVPLPKPRGVTLTADEIYISERTARRAEKKKAEEALKAEEKKKAESTSLKLKAKSKKAEEKKEAEPSPAEKITFIGEEETPDFNEGLSIEKKITELPCIWDEPMSYDLQVNLMLTLQRITEILISAGLSIQQSRTLDAVLLISTGAIAAIADATMHQLAYDEPSEVCAHLLGKTIDGRQLGHPGFGLSIGTFATQSETLEIHSPELAIARTGILDYFLSPNQRRLDKIFSWEEDYKNSPGKNLIKYLRMVCREIGFAMPNPHMLMCDGLPMISQLMKSYPELHCYRDISFWWKYLLNTDRKIFPNYISTDQPTEVGRQDRMSCQLVFNWDDSRGGYSVTAMGRDLRCRPDPTQTDPITGKTIPPDQLPTHRYPSTATPSFYLPAPAVKTEDDVIYRPNLPNFEDKYGQVLNQRDSELLISYLTVPYMRLPLILTFFASEDRIHKFQSAELRFILDSVMFEPGKYLRVEMSSVQPMMVPSPQSDLLASPFGLLLNELCRSPDTVIRSVLLLLRGALACDTGSVVDEDSTTFNTSTLIILYLSRLGCRVDNYVSFLIDYTLGKHDCIDWPLREMNVSEQNLSKLLKGLSEIREMMHNQFNPLFEDYLRRLDQEIVKDPNNEKMIDRNSRLACDLHAHKLLAYRNYHEDELTPDIVKSMIGSFIYLTTRHTWNKTIVGGTRLQVPEVSLYEIIQVTRRRLVTWLSTCKQRILDEVMQTALQVSSSLTGSLRVNASSLDNQNRWSRISGDRSVSRWAVGSTRTVSSNLSEGNLNAKEQSAVTLRRQLSGDKEVGEVVDNGVLGVEIDIGLGQMTLRSKHLAALIPDIASHQDTLHLFGDATIQASTIEKTEHMQKYRLVGLNHEIEHWPTPHTVCPPLDDQWDREYDPSDLFETETWIPSLFEPVRKSFFDGPRPPPMQFLMTEKPTPEDAEVVIMLGLHQNIGGPWKLVYLFRRLKCIHVYECVTQGREWFFTLHMTTDLRYSLHELSPVSEDRQVQYPDFWIRAGGNPYPRGVNGYLVNDIDGVSPNAHASICIYREQQHPKNFSGGKERFVPARMMFGLIPDALLDAYDFWEDESKLPAGVKLEPKILPMYKRLRGYPKASDGEYMIFVEFFYHGSWESHREANRNSPDVIQITGFPGRSVRIRRRPKVLVEEEFHQRQRLASLLESLQLLLPDTKQKKKEAKAEETADTFKIDAQVESDYEGKGQYWPCIVRRVNDDGSYDIEFVDQYKWVGIQRGVAAELVQRRGESAKKANGEGVWRWEGMSDSEDDDWREDSDEEEDVEEDTKVKKRVDFYQFDNLHLLLEAAGGDEEVCMSILNRLGSVPGVLPFTDINKLAKVVADTNKSFKGLGPIMKDDEFDSSSGTKPYDSEDMVLLNLLYSPRRSRLFSIMKVLSRIENMSHVCAWTKLSSIKQNKELNIGQIELGCPPIDLVELPRLKLAFTGREDHTGVLRLYSVDHVDLFIANESDMISPSMLSGIPHSLILSNVRGEVNVLVPVIPPIRPKIAYEPFSTFIVLDRAELAQSERFFLYPVHVSFSFLLTKGLNSGVYLMLLRFMHRIYDEVFRLADSIATDNKFNADGLQVFKAFDRCNDDWHPDAHACRLKIFLVTMDSGMESPWDLTTECARYSVKLDSISSNCKLSISEELQILESDLIVTSTSHPKFDKDIHDEYSMALCFNRRSYLRSIVNHETSASCKVPPRALLTNWPYYQDNTVFGYNYQSMKEISSANDGEDSWSYEVKGGDETDAPDGGWLVVALFHTLWSTGSLKVMPALTELVAVYQDIVPFLSVKADCAGLIEIAKNLNVNVFPTIIIFRGGIELDRIVGSERSVEKFVRSLASCIREEDKVCRAKYRHRIRMEKALEFGEDYKEEVIEEAGSLEWTFDPEHSGSSYTIDNDGMRAVLAGEEEDESAPVTWQWRNRYGDYDWETFSPDLAAQIEQAFRTTFFVNTYLYISGYELYCNSETRVKSYEVVGITGTEYTNYNSIEVRRLGDRMVVPGEEQYVSNEQKEIDRRNEERKLEMIEYAKKLKLERRGKNIEIIRGSIGFLPNSGVHEWKFRWNHEPVFLGKGDAIGVCSDGLEDFGMGPAPRLGGNDSGLSLGLYADGNLFFDGSLLGNIPGARKDQNLSAALSSDPIPTDVPVESHAAGVDETSSKETDSSTPIDKSSTSDDVNHVLAESKEEEPVAAANIPSKDVAPLFGKNCVVGCKLDTSDGGILSFYVNGVYFDELKIVDIFKKLGGNEIFPCICISPVDEIEVQTVTPDQEAKPTSEQPEGHEAETKTPSEAAEDDLEEQNVAADEAKLEEGSAEVVEDKYANFPSVTVLFGEEEETKPDNKESSPDVANATVESTEPLEVSDAQIDPANAAVTGDGLVQELLGDSAQVAADESKDPDASAAAVATEPVAEATASNDEVKVVDVPVDKVRWMYEIEKSSWQLYSVEISKEIELASREGKSEYRVKMKNVANGNDEIHQLKIETNMYTKDDGTGNEYRIRRHVVGDGLKGMWEMLSLKYEKPYGLSGQGTLKLLEKVWRNGENTSGQLCGLGFLFLYGLMSGDIRCKVMGSGGYSSYSSAIGPSMPGRYDSGGGGGGYSVYGRNVGSSATDSHRFGLLLTQLLTDKQTKSITSSVLNVLGRNRQVSLRMPKFKDTRKADHSPFYNGWVDESEPRSPVGELFGKLVPLMTSMKRKGAFLFPPPPPYAELPSAPSTAPVLSTLGIETTAPSLSDYGCDQRLLTPIPKSDIKSLIKEVKYRLDSTNLKSRLPVEVHGKEHFEKLIAEDEDRLIIADFFAPWCKPCQSLSPVFSQLSLQFPIALFLKIDIEDCDDLAKAFEVQSFPTIHFMRGGCDKENILATINGGGPQFIVEFLKTFSSYASAEELDLLKKFHSHDIVEDERAEAMFDDVSSSPNQLNTLANQPLRDLLVFIQHASREQLGMPPVSGALAFDVSQHDASKTAPAASVLTRFRNDVEAYAEVANSTLLSKINGLSDHIIADYFDGSAEAVTVLQSALANVKMLNKRLSDIRDTDSKVVRYIIPLLYEAINQIDITSETNTTVLSEKTKFILSRYAYRKSTIWIEFFFGALLSTNGKEDILKLNPYISERTLDILFNLVSIIMLRANRLSHVNRCIGIVVGLESLLKKVLDLPADNLASSGPTLIPKVIQAGEDLSKNVVMGRYYVSSNESGLHVFDPRFLVFEFVWSIQLRKKQVEIVNDFRASLSNNVSKVRQMIMGAGKTSVVAPLLALILADGKSLVLSVVPKALVEMSRTRLRETFASIMVKRIYTLEFDRSTTVKASMRRGLENAAVNRGVVVATPTTVKSILLSYIETLQHLKEAHLVGIAARVDELKSQADELSRILQLFKDGIMLLDEVDLILHPLKSELNFPIGEKFDLDGSEDGERWGLPIHLFDAIFYVSSGKVTTFEQRGVALDILKRISAAVQFGYSNRHLQRLPHITLLNIDFYESTLKPLMAEWSYLWLQQQHLHGIDRHEAVQYILEGAAAKSDAHTKVNLIDTALTKIMQERGLAPLEPAPTAGYVRSLTPEQVKEESDVADMRRSKTIQMLSENVQLAAYLGIQARILEEVRSSSQEQFELVSEIYKLDEQLDELSQNSARIAGEMQGSIISLHKKIEEIECPRDDSLDNSVIVWCSPAFASMTSASSSSGETSVATLCGQLEDAGFAIRRVAEPEEAISRARDLMQEGQLRCVIIGGDEHGSSCGPSCVKYHGSKTCLRCGNPFTSHSGHECPGGGRGSFSLRDEATDDAGNYLETVTSLVSTETPYARKYRPVPSSRTAVYAAHKITDEDERMSFWLLGTSIFDEFKPLLKWVSDLPTWPSNKESNETANDTSSSSTVAVDKVKIDAYRSEVDTIEAKKIAAADEYEVLKKQLLQQSAEKNELLRQSIDSRIVVLSEAQNKLKLLTDSLLPLHPSINGDDYKGFIGPANGRDSGLAMAWLEHFYAAVSKNPSSLTLDEAKKVWKYSFDISNELSFLRQMALAAKVVAHVTSPNHKKMLNLCYNWLSTFLPHCLAKVNRVSFGLLSTEDCKAALAADPNVPRSRLKLAVPFIGKDVPSKSSEFAHPDIVIGMTVLAFRYSGLRKDDFIDIVDGITSDFTKEIGPARDRKSSQRHEDWVYAAGGRVRGLKSYRDGLPWDVNESLLTEEEVSEKEVVQLKFLQKSNEEQMEKLFNLIKSEPLVIHYYLQKSIFPTYMRSQRVKLSASGQAVGGDMIVGKRVGFSGTPSDLLPQELGRCDYETGDDGMMLTTCLDRKIASYEVLDDKWSVEQLLEKIAKADSPRYNALIDTGALITGYSNQQVARQLLDRGLTWCEGVVFLDDDDKQQVLVRATGRVVSADQCGVSLEKRFAFYDQIHTTGMDIKHVVNAIAVVTLGKDLTFRDYVQGCYRMRGIGAGQRIHVYIIPEVKELMGRELRKAVIPVAPGNKDNVLECVVAWLVINSLRSEQTQWTMLCLQNISNLYRKNAYRCLHKKTEFFYSPNCNRDINISHEMVADKDSGNNDAAEEFADSIDPNVALKVFDESIDFSLEASVPDPLPFEKRLRALLENNDNLLLPEQHVIGHNIMIMVGQFSMVEISANRLDSEQERELENEQEKEVEARRDQQIEVEKFVDREYSRQEETQRPWPFSVLAKPYLPSDMHPFYHLKDFKLRHHEALQFPDALLVSTNYFNQNWKGLRRVKNVVMILEYAPSTSKESLRLKTPAEAQLELNNLQQALLLKAHGLLGFHAAAEGKGGFLLREDLVLAIKASTDVMPSDELITKIFDMYGENGQYLSYEGLKSLLSGGLLFPEHFGRYWVAISLAEAETIRRILHVRSSKGLDELIPRATTEIALRYSPLSAPTSLSPGGDGGAVFDFSKTWSQEGTGATIYEAAVAHSCFRFYDCDMHFSNASLNILVRSLRGSPKDRERFFLSTIGCKRRMERKWQDTPLAKVFLIADQWVALKQQAQSVYINEALKAKNLTLWEAFTAIDSDNNGILSPSEVFGALRWLQAPNITADDVVDFIEAADKNRDGMLDYREYIDILTSAIGNEADGDQDNDDRQTEILDKIEPYGADELREIMVSRKQKEQAFLREERLRKQAYKEALDIKIFEEELEASRTRKGGANPLITNVPTADLVNGEPLCITDYKFSSNEYPLRYTPVGKSNFMVIYQDTAADPKIKPFRCSRNHELSSYRYYWMSCTKCSKTDTNWICWSCFSYFCSSCVDGHRKSQEHDRRDVTRHPTCLRCQTSSNFSLQIPSIGGSNKTTGQFTICMDIRLPKLPGSGWQSLLRFSSADGNSQSRKSHRASVLVNGQGIVVNDIANVSLAEEELKMTPHILPGIWTLIAVVVDPKAGSFTSYINGKKCITQLNIDASDLQLYSKIIIFGGGTQSQCKGGDIRRFVVYDAVLSEEAILKSYWELAQDHPFMGGRVLKIQKLYRGWKARKSLKVVPEVSAIAAAADPTEASDSKISDTISTSKSGSVPTEEEV